MCKTWGRSDDATAWHAPTAVAKFWKPEKFRVLLPLVCNSYLAHLWLGRRLSRRTRTRTTIRDERRLPQPVLTWPAPPARSARSNGSPNRSPHTRQLSTDPFGQLTSKTMNSRLFGGLCCFAAAVVLPIILITLGEVTIPTAFRDGVHQQLVMDSQAEVDEWIREDDGWVTNNSVTFVFYSTPLPVPERALALATPIHMHAARGRPDKRQGDADVDACSQASVRGHQRGVHPKLPKVRRHLQGVFFPTHPSAPYAPKRVAIQHAALTTPCPRQTPSSTNPAALTPGRTAAARTSSTSGPGTCEYATRRLRAPI